MLAAIPRQKKIIVRYFPIRPRISLQLVIILVALLVIVITKVNVLLVITVYEIFILSTVLHVLF